MSELEAYVGRVRGLLIELSDRLTTEQCDEVEHLISHGEPAEGMRTLAWILVETGRKVPADVVARLREFASDLVPEEDMPPGLDGCIEG